MNAPQEAPTTTEARMRALIAEMLGLTEAQVQPHSRFVADLGSDSLDVVELVMAAEDEFGLEIPDEDAERLATVAAAIEYVERKLSAKVAQVGQSPHELSRRVDIDSLSSLELNWVVARLLGRNIVYSELHGGYGDIDSEDTVALDPLPAYSSNWGVGGPLVERFSVGFVPVTDRDGVIEYWRAIAHGIAQGSVPRTGTDTLQLRAAMKAVVLAHMGQTVALPAVMVAED